MKILLSILYIEKTRLLIPNTPTVIAHVAADEYNSCVCFYEGEETRYGSHAWALPKKVKKR